MHSGIHVETINEKYDRRYDQPVIKQHLFPIADPPVQHPGNDDPQYRQHSNPQQAENGDDQNFIVHIGLPSSYKYSGSIDKPLFSELDCTSEGRSDKS
jgi:hypothetical protein